MYIGGFGGRKTKTGQTALSPEVILCYNKTKKYAQPSSTFRCAPLVWLVVGCHFAWLLDPALSSLVAAPPGDASYHTTLEPIVRFCSRQILLCTFGKKQSYVFSANTDSIQHTTVGFTKKEYIIQIRVPT